MLTSIFKAAKDNYYKSTLKDNTDNNKNTWQLTNEILRRKDSSKCTSFNVQGESITGNQEIANGFNDYFCSVANDLAQDTDEPLKQF